MPTSHLLEEPCWVPVEGIICEYHFTGASRYFEKNTFDIPLSHSRSWRKKDKYQLKKKQTIAKNNKEFFLQRK